MTKTAESAMRHVYSTSDVSAFPVGSPWRVAEFSDEHLIQHGLPGLYAVAGPERVLDGDVWHLVDDRSCLMVWVAIYPRATGDRWVNVERAKEPMCPASIEVLQNIEDRHEAYRVAKEDAQC